MLLLRFFRTYYPKLTAFKTLHRDITDVKAGLHWVTTGSDRYIDVTISDAKKKNSNLSPFLNINQRNSSLA